MNQMRVNIILETGEWTTLCLRNDDIRKLEDVVRKQNEYYRERGDSKTYSIAEELSYGIREHLKLLPDPAEENETPAAETAGGSE